MKVKVLVVAADDSARRKYLEAVSAEGAVCRGVSSLAEMQVLLLREPFNGVLIDVRSSLLADGEGKRFLNLVEHTYPVAKARVNPKGNVIALVDGRKQEGDAIQAFVARHCRNFKERKIRSFQRQRAHFNVLLSPDPSMENAVRTFTVEASANGCFVFFDGALGIGDTVWLRFAELRNAAPVEARVMRRVPWGSRPMTIPGLGLSIVGIADDQQKDLAEKILSPPR